MRSYTDCSKNKIPSWWGNRTKAGQLRQDTRGNLIAQIVQVSETKKVLELGCADGEFTLRLAKRGGRIISSDISFELVKLTKNKVKSKNVFLVVADAYDLPFKNCCFDAVVGNAILHHLELNPTLSEIKRVMVNRGIIAFAEPNMLNPQVFLEKNIRVIGRFLQNTPDESAFLRWKIKKKLETEGFKYVVVEPFDFIHPLTPPQIISFVKGFGSLMEKTPIIKEIAGSLLITGYYEKLNEKVENP